MSVATRVHWLEGERRFPGEHRLPWMALIAKLASNTWQKGKETNAIRFYLASRP